MELEDEERIVRFMAVSFMYIEMRSHYSGSNLLSRKNVKRGAALTNYGLYQSFIPSNEKMGKYRRIRKGKQDGRYLSAI